MEKPIGGAALLAATLFILTACPATKSPTGESTTASPPGKTSIKYNCDISQFSPSLAAQLPSNDVYFTWLDADKALPSDAQAILVSDAGFGQRNSSVTFIVDKKRAMVDQIRDRTGKPLEFDLSARYVTQDIALAQTHMRIGSMVLESATRAIQSADGKSAAQYVSFSFDTRLFDVLREETVPPVEGYGPLPRRIVSTTGTVCEFKGFAKSDN